MPNHPYVCLFYFSRFFVIKCTVFSLGFFKTTEGQPIILLFQIRRMLKAPPVNPRVYIYRYYKVVKIANVQLLTKCYAIKMVKLPGFLL